jgi:hypothetical protein
VSATQYPLTILNPGLHRLLVSGTHDPFNLTRPGLHWQSSKPLMHDLPGMGTELRGHLKLAQAGTHSPYSLLNPWLHWQSSKLV